MSSVPWTTSPGLSVSGMERYRSYWSSGEGYTVSTDCQEERWGPEALNGERRENERQMRIPHRPKCRRFGMTVLVVCGRSEMTVQRRERGGKRKGQGEVPACGRQASLALPSLPLRASRMTALGHTRGDDSRWAG